ncbi:MAG TPA: hypothetical protein DD435_12135 [Cyanobacteria bacterium UBA8530]|nr:hypothetical protein [Cyanobacteria bacterium UBA8530]
MAEESRERFLPDEPGLVLVYEESFDGGDLGESRLEVLSLEKKEGGELLSLRRVRGEEETIEEYRLDSRGAWKTSPEGEELIWEYPVEESEWTEEDPRVGSIHFRRFFGEPVEVAGQRFERVLTLTSDSEGGQSLKYFAPRIGLLKSSYLADGTPGERILKEIRRSKV